MYAVVVDVSRQGQCRRGFDQIFARARSKNQTDYSTLARIRTFFYLLDEPGFPTSAPSLSRFRCTRVTEGGGERRGAIHFHRRAPANKHLGRGLTTRYTRVASINCTS